ncbi:hypothetical protein DPEC_G00123920 [Dallia pectoralis]|uniref:Uncharacterized protein n=1 Tax=Dallia pectoralis TaxID=75939 RepID=A0ACC2GRC2_DALPE|nr:hypothetical protein DPEC_G00123920 [Dallia pectoralis]
MGGLGVCRASIGPPGVSRRSGSERGDACMSTARWVGGLGRGEGVGGRSLGRREQYSPLHGAFRLVIVTTKRLRGRSSTPAGTSRRQWDHSLACVGTGAASLARSRPLDPP